MSDFQAIWKGLDWSVLTDILSRILPALICITLHEMGHGFVALLLGDTTARDMGRLSLNPLHHIDWMGLLMMVAFRFGWAKPVPVNMYRFQNPKRGMAITALAGPVTSLLISVVMLLLYGFLFPLSGSGLGSFFAEVTATTAYLSLSLAVFNLLPVPPLDGSKVLFSLLSDEQYDKLMRYERYGMLLLLALVSTGILSKPLSGVTTWIFKRLFSLSMWSYSLVS